MDTLFSKRVQNASVNIIREIAKRTAGGGYISFAGGNPAPDTFPAEALAGYAAACLTEKKVAALQYGVTAGYPPLRQWISDYLRQTKGIDAPLENILITSGSQQGISLLSTVFLNEGDGVIVEDPTYVAALQIFRPYAPAIHTVGMDEDGVLYDDLAEIAKTGSCKLFYSVPTFQNPTGACMAQKTRERLPELMNSCNMILIEDDPYGDLYYDEKPVNPVKSHDTFGRVVYMGSFSKIVAPGLRVGYIVADTAIIAKLEAAKQSADLNSCNLSQVLLHEYLSSGALEEHLRFTRELYRQKRDYMLAQIEQRFPPETQVWRPGGGLFIWVKLPAGQSAYELLQRALEEKVAFIPARSFYAGGGVDDTMRLNFSSATQEQVAEGIAILGKLMR